MIVLASNSDTRAKILKSANVEFIQRGCDFDETSVTSNSARDFVYAIAKGKKECYLKRYTDDLPFLVADTVVVANGKLLQKAIDVDDARRMLNLQSNNSVSILTCMIYKSASFELIDISETRYIFEKFDDNDLSRYLQSDEWKGKAGACMVEGFCKPYIKEVVGEQSTAMGLSIEKLIPFINRLQQ